jgi:magnesium-transporting ATPase (P-type)
LEKLSQEFERELNIVGMIGFKEELQEGAQSLVRVLKDA